MKEAYANELLKISRDGYDNVAKNFSETRNAFWNELSFLKSYLKNGDKILDIGCGNGRFFEQTNEVATKYTGIDSSSELIKLARGKYPDATFLTADALMLPFEDFEFDIAFSFAVIHHIPSKKLRIKFLKETGRVIKNDGLFIFTAWDLWNKKRSQIIKNSIKKMFGFSNLDFGDIMLGFFGKDLRYLHAFTKRELRSLVKEAGLNLEKIEVVRRKSGEQNYLVVCRKKA